MKDSIDFGSMHIPTLFRKLLIPTVLGMVFSAIFIITDGIFVGKGIGSDALAAVNITAPLFLINTGVALMFGIGASVVASIHLSHGKPKVARINVTQAIIVSSLLLIAYAVAILCNVEQVARLLGSSERLLPLAVEYMHWFVPFLVFSALLSSGMFFVRLDGSPNYAMTCNIIPALINIFLDWLFIYVFRWGMFGAALATSLGYIVGALMILVYLMQRQHVIRLERIKLSLKSLRLTVRNVGYMMRLGLSTFLCEAAIATMMFVGNYVFIRYLGEDGVAAFSIACYFFPIIFMVYNAIAQSAQPILSYNYGASQPDRVRSAFRLALWTAVTCGVVVFIITELFTEGIVGLFVDRGCAAYDIALHGLPLFAAGFVCFGINIVSIGYFQSVERDRPAMAVTLLRGFILVLLCFWLMPIMMGVPGIWLAVPAAETLTLLFVLTIYCRGRKRKEKLENYLLRKPKIKRHGKIR
ncbi:MULTISPECIES: MATE family efflux transporter [unclassified Bacteroides]|uniref:MATE family efflux transporter n=2 Tax=Bacteroides TaxID=816 RepID=UPI002588ECC3|nr:MULTISPECIES: MATE family efflux transporter [unclassified Bacteroides]MDO3388940.1 MATE family efflux transporter [Bacteroides sp. ET489]